MAALEDKAQMRVIQRAFKKMKMTHSTKTKGGWLTKLADPQLLFDKFVARWGVEPTHYCFWQLKGTYVLLGPVPQN